MPLKDNWYARLQSRKELKFATVLFRADPTLAVSWWTVLILRGVLPAIFSIAMGALVAAVQNEAKPGAALAVVGIVFVALQILAPIHQALGQNLGNRTSQWLYGQLTDTCISQPGMGHLEDPSLTNDLTMSREFDLGMMGPPLSVCMGFIASGMVEMFGGIASAMVLAAYHWWAAVLLVAAWVATHYLLRESAIWKDRNTEEVKSAQRHADYHYRLAVDAPAAKELRLFGLADWVVDRFRQRRRQLVKLQWEATRLRERKVVWSLLIVASANVIVFWSMGAQAIDGTLSLGRLVTFASAAVGVSMIAFGGLSWALDFAASPAESVLRLRESMEPVGSLAPGYQAADGKPRPRDPFPQRHLRLPRSRKAGVQGLRSHHPRGRFHGHRGPERSRQNHPRKVALPSL